MRWAREGDKKHHLWPLLVGKKSKSNIISSGRMLTVIMKQTSSQADSVSRLLQTVLWFSQTGSTVLCGFRQEDDTLLFLPKCVFWPWLPVLRAVCVGHSTDAENRCSPVTSFERNPLSQLHIPVGSRELVELLLLGNVIVAAGQPGNTFRQIAFKALISPSGFVNVFRT